MPRGPRGYTRGEVRSRLGEPPRGWAGRSDAAGVAPARVNAAAEPESRGLRKSVVGRDCNAVATSTESSQMVLGQRDSPIQAFPPQRPDEPFAEPIRLWASHG